MALFIVATVFYLASVGVWYLPIKYLKNAVFGEVKCNSDLFGGTVQQIGMSTTYFSTVMIMVPVSATFG